MSSPDPSAHKCIGRGVRNYDSAVWDRVREDAVLAGNSAKFLQNPTMKHHLLSAGTNILAEASHFDPVWGFGLRADDPEARDPRRWRGKQFLGKALSSVRDAIRTGEAGLGTQASFQQFCTPTTTIGIHEISPAPPHPRALARACPGPPTEFSTCFSMRRRTASPRSWLSRLESSSPSRYQNMAPTSSVVSLLSTAPLLPRRLRFTVELTPSRPMVAWRSGSPQTFIIRDVLDRMLSVGVASVECERNCSPRS